MLLMSIIAICLGIFNSHFAEFNLSKLLLLCAIFFNQHCQTSAPISEFSPLYVAIVCGRELSHSYWKTIFQNTGLYHIIVVSGAHLVFLQTWLKPLTRWLTPWASQILLLLFTITCFNPPIFRAWLQYTLSQVLHKKHLSIVQLHWLAGLCTLAVMPEWSHSLSLQLSWLAALTMDFPLKKSSTIKRATLIFILLFPLLLTIGSPHPAHIIANTLLAPLIGGLLFPASLLSFLLPMALPLTDGLWRLVIWCLEDLAHQAPAAQNVWESTLLTNWCYVLSLQLCCHLLWFKKNQEELLC